VAERWGVSRQSVYAWMDRYAAGGLEGLAERSHRPHQIPAAVEARIGELRRRHPDWGPRRLRHELGRDGVQPLPSRSAIYRSLVRQQLVEPVARRRRVRVGPETRRQSPGGEVGQRAGRAQVLDQPQ
jgi:transposase